LVHPFDSISLKILNPIPNDEIRETNDARRNTIRYTLNAVRYPKYLDSLPSLTDNKRVFFENHSLTRQFWR
jgi:hypothetical protein